MDKFTVQSYYLHSMKSDGIKDSESFFSDYIYPVSKMKARTFFKKSKYKQHLLHMQR